MKLKNKIALITGGNKGIGAAIVKEFVKEGAQVAFTYRKDPVSARKLLKQLNGRKALSLQLDITDFDQAKQVVETIKEKLGGLDILVNNAGINKDSLLMFMSKDDWDNTINTNLNGIFNVTRASIFTFMKQKSGSIVNISSVAAIVGLPGQTNYAASKAGIIGFTKSLAKEVAKTGINVNAVAPGFIETDMLTRIPDKLKKEILNMVPMGRVGRAEEVAKLVTYLASDVAAYITGQTLNIDGGITA
ncbi:MAG: 3-oxoacyl-[acyl-carrier-protein] reductase [Candidatus Omnitrophota bacterium]